jgi:large subunit ribosomal protein L3
MATPHGSRRGSMQYWPRVRAQRIHPKISFWTGNGVLGFSAYKVGMVQYLAEETRNNVNKGKEVIFPATVLEIPPVYPISVSFYKKTFLGKKKIASYFDIKALPKDLKKDIKRKFNYKTETGGKIPEKFDEIRLEVATFPRKIDLKKTPEIFELGASIGLEEAKGLMGKELKIGDFFSAGEYIEVTAITKGKGTQGVVKRFGCKLRNHHTKKGRRHIGSVGGVTPRKISYRVPFAGQMGYGQRTELNKLILKISDNPEEVNPKEGFKEYGLVKGSYILLEGSVPGARKRMVVIRKPREAKKANLEIKEILK